MLSGKIHIVIGKFAAGMLGFLLLCSSARATQFVYQFNMNGPSENPPNASSATARVSQKMRLSSHKTSRISILP